MTKLSHFHLSCHLVSIPSISFLLVFFCLVFVFVFNLTLLFCSQSHLKLKECSVSVCVWLCVSSSTVSKISLELLNGSYWKFDMKVIWYTVLYAIWLACRINLIQHGCFSKVTLASTKMVITVNFHSYWTRIWCCWVWSPTYAVLPNAIRSWKILHHVKLRCCWGYYLFLQGVLGIEMLTCFSFLSCLVYHLLFLLWPLQHVAPWYKPVKGE